jgi:hypothetical protein
MCDHLDLRRQVKTVFLLELGSWLDTGMEIILHLSRLAISDSVPNEILHVLHTGLVLYSAVVTVHELSLLPFY